MESGIDESGIDNIKSYNAQDPLLEESAIPAVWKM